MKYITILLFLLLLLNALCVMKPRSHNRKDNHKISKATTPIPQEEKSPEKVKLLGTIEDKNGKKIEKTFKSTPDKYKGVFPQFPPNNGAIAGSRIKAKVLEGKILFRYGSLGGKFLTEQCSEEKDLSLPLVPYVRNLHCFKVTKEFYLEYGKIAPWYLSKGGKGQFVTNYPIKEEDAPKKVDICSLLQNGYLEYYRECTCKNQAINKRIIRSAAEAKEINRYTDDSCKLDDVIKKEKEQKMMKRKH